jgi:hypothetical protein
MLNLLLTQMMILGSIAPHQIVTNLTASAGIADEIVVSPTVGAGFVLGDRADADSVVDFTISVQQPSEGIARIKFHVAQVSDPSSSVYGDYLTQAEIDAITAPSQESFSAVTAWLDSVAGIACVFIQLVLLPNHAHSHSLAAIQEQGGNIEVLPA